jgi:sporulation protein YlmC with PRC-barrel domain
MWAHGFELGVFMDETTQYAIGAEVHCRDGVCGRLGRVVIDPVAGQLTHLVVEPEQGQGVGRLVPIDLVSAPSDGPDIRLRCGLAVFGELEPAEETEFLPGGGDDHMGYRSEQLLMWPYYGLGVGMMGAPGLLTELDTGARTESYERVPRGEVQVRRGERVEAMDGEVGQVKGLVIDPQDHGVTHVLLEEGHLWGKKVVGIPIRAVTYADGGIRVQLTKKELSDLPPVDFAEQG